MRMLLNHLGGRGQTWARVAAAVLALTVATACGDEETTTTGGTGSTTDTGADVGQVEQDTTEEDTAGTDGTDATVLDIGSDSGSTDSDADASTPDTADVGSDVSNPCPGGAGCACNDKNDCTESGVCILTQKGKVCAALCKTTKCGAEEVCTPYGSPDVVDVCIPKWGSLCNPCNANQDCLSLDPGAKCIDGGDNGAFCGSGCVDDASCPGGYECKDSKDVTGATSKQCVVKGAAACTCNKYAVDNKLSTTCFKVAGGGGSKCKGARTCTAEGLSGCVAADPAPEECNGKDDDCNGQIDEGSCDDKNACTENICKGAGGCENPAKNGTCDADGSVCTKNDTCVAGKCVAGPVEVCDDKNDCTKDACDLAVGCTYTNDDGKFCDADNNPCTENDLCKTGKCEPGAIKACSASDQCTTGKCSTLDGKCKYSFQDGFACNDGSACTEKDKCVEAKGDCFGSSIVCNDDNECTADSCDPKVGCIHEKNLTTPCNDGDACTLKDTCDKGVCNGTPLDVTKPKSLQGCNDDNPCTTDSCNPAIGCKNTPDSVAACDDGNPCTKNDACNLGVCKPGTNTCACTNDSDCAKSEDGNLCNGTLYCDKAVAGAFECKVNPLTVVTCQPPIDGQCATVQCVPSTGKCQTELAAEGQGCDADKNKCTENDSCKSGLCTKGTALKCDDKNPCTDDSCDPTQGCVFNYNTNPCDADGNACTVGDTCKGGTCVAGDKKVCKDDEFCTTDSCESASGKCVYTPTTGQCDDGNSCTVGDTCGGGKCIPGKGPNCDDTNPCTNDTCDMLKGCQNVPDATIKVTCYSGDPATKGKGVCTAGYNKCGSDGKLDTSSCIGEKLPSTKEACDGVDDTCNGVVDEGCKPTSFAARMGSASLSGTGKTYGAKAFVGGSQVIGNAVGSKNTVQYGFYAWLKSLLGQ